MLLSAPGLSVVALVLFVLFASLVAAALGVLLLLPLQTTAGLQTSRTLNNAQATGIQGAETKLRALRQAVAGAASNAALNQQLQTLQRPLAIPRSPPPAPRGSTTSPGGRHCADRRPSSGVRP